MPKRPEPPTGLSAEWGGGWALWDDLPAALQVAIDWSWRNAQPESPKDRARLQAMDGKLPFERIFHHEGIRWTNRHLKRLLPWLAKEDRFLALGYFFKQADSTIRSIVEGGDKGLWRAAREAERRELHHHADEAERLECPDCIWVEGVRPGSEGLGAFLFPRGDGHLLAFRRLPWSQSGNHRMYMFGLLGASAGPNGRWRVSIHRRVVDDVDGDSVDGEEISSWDEFPVPPLKAFEDGWVELFRVMNPKITRAYTILPPDAKHPQRHLFPPTDDKKLKEEFLGATPE